MRRSTLILAARELADAIEASSLLDVLKGETKAYGPLLSGLNAYAIFESNFSEETRVIASIFELDLLTDADSWPELLDSQAVPLRRTILMRIQAANRTLPRLLALLTQDQPALAVDVDDVTHNSKDPLGLLRVILVEEDANFSTAQRVIDSLDACQEMYTALASLNDIHSVPLGIGAIDSGSDKSFDLFGAAELMKQLNQLILTIWDLVVFHKERKAGRSLELVANSLPILAEISRLESEGGLGREQAEIIRRGIVDGATKFMGTGTITEGMESISSTNPRILMAPEPRLLTGPVQEPFSHKEAESNTRPSPAQNTHVSLSDEDLLRLAALLDKSKENNLGDEPKLD
jgi:hypothetical protein